MEKRLLVAIFLSFLVLYAYQVFVQKPAMEKAKREAPVAAVAPTSGTASGAAQAATAAAPAAPIALAAPLVADKEERDIVVETRTVRAVFTNRGARLKSWQLKTYLDLQKKPQELVAAYMPDYRARPFDLKVDDEAANAALKVALFKASAGDAGRVNVSSGAETLTFEYKDASGLSARKAFTFEPTGFIVRVAVDVEAGGKALNPTVLWGLGLGDQDRMLKMGRRFTILGHHCPPVF